MFYQPKNMFNGRPGDSKSGPGGKVHAAATEFMTNVTHRLRL